jgi:hypothetical protein
VQPDVSTHLTFLTYFVVAPHKISGNVCRLRSTGSGRRPCQFVHLWNLEGSTPRQLRRCAKLSKLLSKSFKALASRKWCGSASRHESLPRQNLVSVILLACWKQRSTNQGSCAFCLDGARSRGPAALRSRKTRGLSVTMTPSVRFSATILARRDTGSYPSDRAAVSYAARKPTRLLAQAMTSSSGFRQTTRNGLTSLPFALPGVVRKSIVVVRTPPLRPVARMARQTMVWH